MSVRPCRVVWTLPRGNGWRAGALLLAAGGLAQADTGGPGQLPRPDAARDPGWIARLPPATLPLPRPGAAVSGSSRPGQPVSAPVADQREAVADGGTLVASSPADRGVATPAADAEGVAEDSSRVEVLERQVIGTSGREAPAPAETPVTATGPGAASTAVMVPPAPAPAPVTPTVAPAPVARLAAPPVAVPAGPPSSATAPAGPVAAPGYRWQVQLLAGRSLDKVREDWRLFVQRRRAMLEGLTLTISQSHFGDARDDFYRLRVLDWTDETAADRWCARLRAAGGQCFVTRVTAPPE